VIESDRIFNIQVPIATKMEIKLQAFDTDWNPIYRASAVKDVFGEKASVTVTVKLAAVKVLNWNSYLQW
jgi:hypothetical protein